jgi:phosphopantothenoylcysteine decarboxylase/phosphopantothenate--cysteine ligase
MGYALAEECARRGATVELISGPVQLKPQHPNIHLTKVESAKEMFEAATRTYPTCQAGILCAAVADFTPAHVADQKIKREGDDLQLRLLPNPDIAAELGRMKQSGQRLVGFALETNDEQANAQKKLQKKNLDFIVLNSLRNEGTCFQSDENQISIINADGQRDYERKSKSAVAKDIIDQLAMLL